MKFSVATHWVNLLAEGVFFHGRLLDVVLVTFSKCIDIFLGERVHCQTLFLVLVGKVAKVEAELFEENEGEDGVGPEPDEGRDEPLEEGHRSLPRREHEQVDGSLEFSRLGIHRSCL